MNGKTTTEGHYRTYTSPNNFRIAQDNVTTRDYHLESGLQDSGSELISYTIHYTSLQYVQSDTGSISPVYNMYNQLQDQLHQFTICTVNYTIHYNSLQHKQSDTGSITPVYNMYSQLQDKLHQSTTFTISYSVSL